MEGIGQLQYDDTPGMRSLMKAKTPIQKIMDIYGIRERVEFDDGTIQNELINTRVWKDLGVTKEHWTILEEYCLKLGLALFDRPYRQTRFISTLAKQEPKKQEIVELVEEKKELSYGEAMKKLKEKGVKIKVGMKKEQVMRMAMEYGLI